MRFVVKLGSSVRDVLWRSTRHWLSALGATLALVTAVSFFVVFAAQLLGRDIGPYTGIISYLVMPAVFVFGLLLIPLGLWLLRRREAAGKASTYPVIDLNQPKVRSVGLAVILFTVANLLVVSTATYQGLEVLHSDAFCGGVCHSVMQPEQVAHQLTPHANVRCADCHVGEGATHWTKSKLRGAGQVWQMVTGDIQRPAPQPVEVPKVNCTRCHAEQRFTEDRLRIARHFSDDEKTVEKTSVWRMRVGGFRDGKWSGVHAHNGMKVSYLADRSRQTVSAVKVTRADGTSDLFEAKGAQAPPGAEWFEMDCTDCHNRAGHDFRTPEKIVDGALGRGTLDVETPYIRKRALEALSKPYASAQQAATEIPLGLSGVPEAASRLLAAEWAQSNFPQMNVSAQSYRNYQQHDPGCYRCHDKNHVDSKGAEIQKKCAGTCHDLIADHEEKPEALDVLFP